MKLIKVYAENYCLIKEKQEFIFEDDITLITGGNRSAKSTILKIIKLCLFNDTDSTLSDDINEDSKYFEIGLVFEHLNNHYTICINYDGKVTDRNLSVNDDEINYKGQEAIDYLKTIFNPAIYKSAMFAMQNEIDIVNEKPSDRRKTLQKVRDLEFKKEIEDIEFDIKELNSKDLNNVSQEIHTLESKDYTLTELSELPFQADEYKNKQIELENINDQIQSNKIEFEKINNMKQSIEKEKSSIQNYNDTIEKYNSNLSENLNQIKTIKDDISNTDSNKDIEKEESSVNKKIVDIEKQVTNKQNEIKELKIVRLSSSWEKESELNEVLEKGVELKNTVFNLEKKLKAWEKGECSECLTKFDHSDKDISDLKNEIQKVLLQKEEYLKKYQDLKKDKQDYEERIKENEKFKSQKVLLKKDITSLQEKIETLKSNFNETKLKIKENCEKLIQEKNDKLQVIENNNTQIKKDIIDTEEKLKKAKNSLSELELEFDLKNKNNNEVDIDKLIIQKESLQKEIKNYETVVTENKVIEKNNKEILKSKEADTLKLKEFQTKKDKIIEEIDVLSKSKSILQKELPTFILSSLIKEIETGINKFVEEVCNDDLRVKVIDKKNAIHIVFGKNNRDIRKGSGFEQQLITLAYKHVLNSKADIGVICMDEFDNNAEESNVLRLYDVFGAMLKFYKQVIIITHNNLAKDKLVNDYQANHIEMKNGRIV